MFIFSYSVRYDDNARPVPDALREIPTIANGDVSRDGLTLKYKLRPNMKWHDGAPVTSKDLWFTWQVVMNPHNNVVTTDGYKDIASIDYSRSARRRHPHEESSTRRSCSSCVGRMATRRFCPSTCSAKYNDDKGSFNTRALSVEAGRQRAVQGRRVGPRPGRAHGGESTTSTSASPSCAK